MTAPRPSVRQLGPCLVWAALAGGVGIGVAWLAVVVQPHFAPVVLFPILTGMVFGACLGGLARATAIGGRRAAISAMLLGAVLASVGQHYFVYRQASEQTREESAQLQRARALFPNEVTAEDPLPAGGFWGFLREEARRGRPITSGCVARGWVAWASWGLDTALLVLAAAFVLVPILRQPYCRRCGSWYHVSRTGRLRSETATQVAALLEFAPPAEDSACAYRLFTCRSGCAPTGFELRYREAGGKMASSHAWLDLEQRSAVTALLDQDIQAEDSEPGRTTP